MSARALDWAMRTRRTHDPVQRLVLVYLGDGADHRDESVWLYGGLFPPDDDVLGSWTGLDCEALTHALGDLDRAGIVAVVFDAAEAENPAIVRLDVDGVEP